MESLSLSHTHTHTHTHTDHNRSPKSVDVRRYLSIYALLYKMQLWNAVVWTNDVVIKHLLHDIKINSNIISSNVCEVWTYNPIHWSTRYKPMDELLFIIIFHNSIIYFHKNSDEHDSYHALDASHDLSHTTYVCEQLYKERERNHVGIKESTK